MSDDDAVPTEVMTVLSSLENGTGRASPTDLSPGSSSSGEHSYQHGESPGASPERRHSSVPVQGSSRRRLSDFGAAQLVRAVQQAFAIEDRTYMPAESSDHDEFYDDSDHIARGVNDSSCISPRTIVCLILSLLVAASIGVTVLTRQRPATAVPVDTAASSLVCTDPMQALLAASTLDGIQNGAVASDHPLCSQMGVAILQEEGGNAIDAAVTTALCLGVANPASSGLGGGAFILIHADPPNENVHTPFHDVRTGPSPVAASGKITEVIDAREVAPAAATNDMYLHASSSTSTFGGLAIGVPGELRGLELAHARHGKLPWTQVLDPVMRLALRGVEVNANLAHEIELMTQLFDDDSQDYGLRDLVTRGDSWTNPLREGERLQNQKLSETLQDVMTGGADALYTGERAGALAQDIQDAGGIITKEDLEKYRATLRTPVWSHDVNGFSLVGVPPPSSGGAAILGAARFLAGFESPLASFADTVSPHRIAEASKHVFAIRMSLSDPAYNNETVTEAVQDMTQGDYMESLRTMHSDDVTLPLSKYGGSKWSQVMDTDGGGNATDAQEGDRRLSSHKRRLARRFGYLNDHGTSHFSVIDKDGNAVAMTTSVNTYFGSNVVSASTGIVLGNTMDDFASPGKPNYFGIKPSESNYIEPGKKPLSSMAPTLVFRRKDNRPEVLGDLVLAVGASGGPKIITAVLQVLLDRIMMGRSLFESIVHPRIHDQLIYHDASVSTTEYCELGDGTDLIVSQRTRDAMTRRGHALLDIDYTGCVQAIAVDLETNRLTAACDPRKGGAPAGY